MNPKMTRRFFLQCAASLLIMPTFSVAAGKDEKILSVPVLSYHDLSYKQSDEQSLPPRMFAAQMERLYAGGYHAVSIAQLDAADFPDRSVVITFDDGYASFIPYALPFLQAYGYCATINLIAPFVGSSMRDRGIRPMLSWDEYRYLAKTGLVRLGCRGNRPHTGRRNESAEQLYAELSAFQERFTREMGTHAEIIAWPYGFDDRGHIAAARKAGFRYLLASGEGMFRRRMGTTEIPRKIVLPGETLSTFQSRIEVHR